MNLTPYGYGDRETWGGLSPEPDRKAERLIEDFFTAITDKDGDERYDLLQSLYDDKEGEALDDELKITAMRFVRGDLSTAQMLDTCRRLGEKLLTLASKQAVIFAQK